MESSTPDPKTVRTAREAEGYYELGMYEDALVRAESLVGTAGVGDYAENLAAECLRNLERYDEGVRAYERIVRRDPANVAAWVGLGWCRKRSGRLDLALGAMERMLEVKPEESIGLYNLACYCSLSGEADRALLLLERAIEIDGSYRDLAVDEADFEAIRDTAEFRRILDNPVS